MVDASAAVKWVLEEIHSSAARALLRDALARGRSILAPAILYPETTNALYRRERRDALSAIDARVALERFFSFPIQVVSHPDVYYRALQLARRYALPAAYDAQYLALAAMTDAEFWTADQRLFNTLPRSLRWVRWIATAEPTP